MTRKQLPKVIRRGTEDLREIVANALSNETAPAARRPSQREAIEAEPALAISVAPAANDQSPAKPQADMLAASVKLKDPKQNQAARRRALARRIVERHGAYAAMGGLTPLPIANIVGVTAIITRMVKQLSKLYEVPFARDRTRSLAVGIVGGAVPTGLGAAAASTLGFIVPGAAFAGLAVSALSAGALTRSIGLIFIESFERELGDERRDYWFDDANQRRKRPPATPRRSARPYS